MTLKGNPWIFTAMLLYWEGISFAYIKHPTVIRWSLGDLVRDKFCGEPRRDAQKNHDPTCFFKQTLLTGGAFWFQKNWPELRPPLRLSHVHWVALVRCRRFQPRSKRLRTDWTYAEGSGMEPFKVVLLWEKPGTSRFRRSFWHILPNEP